MAEAGWIYLGLSDRVKCFYCDGGLEGWREEDDPWVEHAGWCGKECGFVRLVKGDQFVETSRAFVNMTLENRRAAMRSKEVQNKRDNASQNLQRDGGETSKPNDMEEVDKVDLLVENKRLREQKMCKVCMDAEVGVVFLPCGHLVVCVNCAPNLKTCAVCRTEIQ